MDYPINEGAFSELMRIHDLMAQENPHPGSLGVAPPFLPWIGSDILKGSPGIYFIGIATRGEMKTAECDLKSLRAYSKEIFDEKLSGSEPFWRYVKEIVAGVFNKPCLEVTSRIGWSNQFKIGVYDLVGKKARNPKGYYARTQMDICTSILKQELEVASNSAVLFLGNVPGNLIYRVCGERDEWDTESYPDLGVWVKSRPHQPPILYQQHPRSWQYSSSDGFQEHVKVIVPLLRQGLAS